MSTWNLGIDDVSEEAQAFKDKLASKDSHISAQQTQLMKQSEQLEELRATLNETLHKLSHETTRALHLETELNIRSEDLRNEKIAAQNGGQALAAAQQKIKEQELEARDLQANLESLSHTSDDHNARSTKLEREKATLEARVRELQANIQQLTNPPTTPSHRRRSSSMSNVRVTSLEQQLKQVRATLSQKDADLLAASQKASQAHAEMVQAGNEKVALEKRMSREIAELQAALEEKEEELLFLRGQENDGTRERELLERIEEDEAKIAALERLVGETQDTRGMREMLSQVEEKLVQERERAVVTEERQVELIREREEALDELERAREEIGALKETLNQREAQIRERITNSAGAVAVNLMDMDHAEPCPTPLIEATSDESMAGTIERMLATIDRLRGERDTLRRSVEFLEHESKFSIEALEEKLVASSSAVNDDAPTSLVNQLRAELDELRGRLCAMAEHEVEVIRGKDEEIRRIALAATASAIVVQHLNFTTDYLERRVVDACSQHITVQEQLRAAQGNLEELVERVKELEVKLDVTVLCLDATTSQRDDLMAQLEIKDSERKEEVDALKAEYQETRQNLKQAEFQLMDVSNALQNVESERNSLTVQVTNLLMDLRAAQDDLTNAESRYSALQFHQLSSMSSNEATQALQDQIAELEMRVLRRTEQVGVHQHDIKRMETNLRLQEERLAEMTTELDMMSAQKAAMVEDCADARDARDQALERLEMLEVTMEGRLEEGDSAVEALVEIVFRTIGGARNSLRRSGENARLTHDHLLRLDGEYKKAMALLEEKEASLASWETSADEVKQSTVALAVSQVGLRRALAYIRQILKENDSLEREVKSKQDVAEESSHVESPQSQVEILQQQADNTASEFATRVSELECQIVELQHAISEIEATHRVTVEELVHSKQQIQASLDQAQLSLVPNHSDDAMTTLRAHHAQELSQMRSRIDDAQTALEDLRASHASAKEELEVKLDNARKAMEEVEQRLADTSDSLQQSALQKEEIEEARETLEKKIVILRSDLKEAQDETGRLSEARNALDVNYRRVKAELVQLKKDHETRIAEDTAQFMSVQQKLQEDLTVLQTKLDAKSLELDGAVKETDRLASELQDEINGRSQDKETYEKELGSANQRHQHAQSASTKLLQEMELAQAQLRASTQEVEALRQEKSLLQEEITTLGAEIQRSISLARFLENQVKESEDKVIAVAEELDSTRADLARSEKAAKAAEVNLSLQSAQHKREMSDLHRQLAALRAQPNLQDALAELEERNNEMEELLRSKCAEIEENDDRALEMLKENKKLATKVESLTRKVQNLQTKLAAAKASIPKTSAVPIPSVGAAPSADPVPGPSSQFILRSRSNTLVNVSPVPPIPMHAPSPAHQTPMHRAVSGPSLLSRPKTPERRALQPTPVFKARTPERRAVSSTHMESTASTIGKKRRAPDDFEACESLPPQGFTADSLPSHELVENATPRVRRVLNSLQSGFTPVRNHAARPTAAMPSPKRLMTGRSARSPPTIADVTNSPRGSSTKARSWLGKIRTQATGKSTDVRPVFERESS